MLVVLGSILFVAFVINTAVYLIVVSPGLRKYGENPDSVLRTIFPIYAFTDFLKICRQRDLPLFWWKITLISLGISLVAIVIGIISLILLV